MEPLSLSRDVWLIGRPILGTTTSLGFDNTLGLLFTVESRAFFFRVEKARFKKLPVPRSFGIVKPIY